MHHVPAHHCWVLAGDSDDHCFGYADACNLAGRVVEQPDSSGRLEQCSKRVAAELDSDGNPLTIVGSRKGRMRSRRAARTQQGVSATQSSLPQWAAQQNRIGARVMAATMRLL